MWRWGSPTATRPNARLRAMRADLLSRCTVLAVIALPRATFRATGTSAASSILVLRNTPPAAEHRVFFALPTHLEELPEVVAAYHSQLQIADCRLQIEAGESPI